MSNLPLILGLDVSKSRTGVCWGRPGDKPRFASIVGSDLSDRQAARRLGHFLTDLTRTERFEAASVEAQIPFMKGGGSSAKVMLALSRMIGVAEFVLDMRSIRSLEPKVASWRAAFLGKGNMKSEPAKRAAKLMCEHLGWEPSNLDEADAAGVWYWSCLQVEPSACQPIPKNDRDRIIGIALGGLPA